MEFWKTLLRWVAVLSLTLQLNADEGEPAPASIRTSAAVVTRYVDAGVRVADESWQVAVEAEQEAVSYGAWLNEPWKRHEQDAREVQLYLGKAFDLPPATLSAGGRLHWFPNLHKDELTRELEFEAALSLPVALALGYAYDLDQEQHHLTATLDLELPASAPLNPVRFNTVTVCGMVESPTASYVYIEAALNMILPLERWGGEIYLGPRMLVNDARDEPNVWWLELGYAWFL